MFIKILKICAKGIQANEVKENPNEIEEFNKIIKGINISTIIKTASLNI